MKNLAHITIMRKTGDEPFIGLSDKTLTLKDFWQWSCSDLIGNTARGSLAEYLVACAICKNKGSRNEWSPYDLETESGIKIEVKSSAYIQSWQQKEYSKIIFSIRSARPWDPETNNLAIEKKRQADIYVFCLLHHEDKKTINPMDLSQWTFYVLPTARLDETLPEGKQISLSKLKKLNPAVCGFSNLLEKINTTAVANKK